jgi:hypothetical protein
MGWSFEPFDLQIDPDFKFEGLESDLPSGSD